MKFSIYFPFKRNSKKGFTLVECLVIFAIIATVTSISWSTFKLLQPSWRLQTAIRDLTGDIRSTQQMAVTEQIDHGIRFSSTTREYQIVRYSTTTQVLFTKSLPNGIDFKEITGFSNQEAIFNPYGAAREPGNISLINSKGETKIIEVRPSGFVKIK